MHSSRCDHIRPIFCNIAWWGHFALYTSRCVCALRFFHHLKCSYFQSLFSAFGEVLNSNPTDSTLIFVAMKRTAAWLEVGQWLWDGLNVFFLLTIWQSNQNRDTISTGPFDEDGIQFRGHPRRHGAWSGKGGEDGRQAYWSMVESSRLQTACVNKPSGLLPLHCQKKQRTLGMGPGELHVLYYW